MFKLTNRLCEFTDNKLLEFCLRYVNGGDNIIEVGPGDASFAEMFIRQRPSICYEFIDIKDNRKFQRERNMQLSDVSISEIDKKDSSVDTIIASQVIEHLKNMSNFFLEAHRVLKPQGLLIIKMPNYSNLFQRVIFFMRGMPLRLTGTLSNSGHINFIPSKHLIAIIKDYFCLLEMQGDVFVDSLFTKNIFRIFKKDLYLVNKNIDNLHFSWNVIMCFKKTK